jgi:hypothetical protein
MTTATVSVLPSHPRPVTGRGLGERVSAGGAAVLSVLGWMLTFAIAASALLVVPIAALVVFGPALLDRL